MENRVLATIRSIRFKKKYTQDYLASKLTLSQSQYGRIENGRATLTIKMLMRILAVLETDYYAFFSMVKDLETEETEQLKIIHSN